LGFWQKLAKGALRLEYRLIVYPKICRQPNTPYVFIKKKPGFYFIWGFWQRLTQETRFLGTGFLTQEIWD